MFQLGGKSHIISGDENLCVFRDGAVLIVDGKPVKRAVHSFKIRCNVQPVKGLELLMVPEGDRNNELYWVYTNERANPVELNDRIVRREINYQVQKVETWGAPPNGYQRVMICRIDVGPNKLPDPNQERS